jgi:hypothetical protein
MGEGWGEGKKIETHYGSGIYKIFFMAILKNYSIAYEEKY